MKNKLSSKKIQKKTRKPRVHKKLSGLEVSIDTFGEIQSSMNIEKINQFLDEHVTDKKLLEQQAHEEKKKEQENSKRSSKISIGSKK